MLTALLLAATLSMPTPDLTCRVRDKHGHLVRSRSRRRLFLKLMRSDGKGMAVDHLVPLACGGCDVPSNMTLLPVAEWSAKTKWERRPCSAWWDGTNTGALVAGRK